jgi:signal transduction histidine kinase
MANPDRSSGNSDLNFHDLFDLEAIQKIQDAFALATGVASIITDTNGIPITRPSNFCDLCQNVIRKTEKGLANCYKSDAILGQVNTVGPTVQPCLSGGLLDGGTSIMAGDQHVANWLIGQVLDETCDIEEMKAYAREIGADTELYNQALGKVTHMPRERFEQICQMLFLIADQLSEQALLNVQLKRNITERKRVQRELVKHHEKLEHLVEERTFELKEAQEELLQNERLATLGRLTATVSHELRNPLATIQTALFSVEDSLENNDYSQVLRPIELAERSISRCVIIIEELNSYTRVKELDISEGSVDAWLRGVIEEQNIPENICCELNLSCDIRASFDQEKLRQVAVNLITNAIHALQEKNSDSKQLQVSTHILDDKYEIRFSDNGVGMSEETKEKVFEPLFSTKGFGVGLGMVIVKNIIDQHHGVINMESKRGEGTTITLRLPVNISEG